MDINTIGRYDYYKKLLGIKERFENGIKSINTDRENLKQNLEKEYIGQALYDMQVEKLDVSEENYRDIFRSELKQLKEDFEDNLQALKVYKGEHLTRDFDILNSGLFSVDKDMLIAMAERNKYNPTMLKAISGYARNNKISFNEKYVSRFEELKNEFYNVLDMCRVYFNGKKGNLDFNDQEKYKHQKTFMEQCMLEDNLRKNEADYAEFNNYFSSLGVSESQGE